MTGNAERRLACRPRLIAMIGVLACTVVLPGSVASAQAATGVGIVGSFGGGIAAGQFGAAVDPNTGDLYASNLEATPNHIVQFVGSEEPFGELAFGSGPSSGIAVDPSVNPSRLYAVQASSEMIQDYRIVGGGSPELESEFSVAGSANTSGPFAGSGQADVALAVDADGTLYFPNQPHNEVQEFTPSGGVGPVPSIAGEGEHALDAPTGVAVGPGGQIYVADTNPNTGEGRVQEFNAAGEFQAVVDSEDADAVGVDSANGNVWVVDGQPQAHAEYVHVYDSAGSLVATSTPASFMESGEDRLSQVLQISVSGVTHDAYASDRGGGSWKILAMGSAPSEVATDVPANVEGNSASASGEVNPGGSASEYWFSYGTEGSCEGAQESAHRRTGEGVTKETVTSVISGLVPGTQYTLCLVVKNAFGEEKGAAVTFATPPAKPVIVAESSDNVSQTVATIDAQINPNNEETSYAFQYGTDATLGQNIEVPGSGTLAGFSSEGQPVSTEVQALQPNTTYYYRAVATNGTGSQTGATQSFVTAPPLPLVSTGAASAVTDATATLAGAVNPGSIGQDGDETNYLFEYGPCATPTTCASSSYPLATGEGSVGEGTSSVAETAQVTELQPNQMYHYRIVAINDNGAGVTRGDEREFSTLPLAPTVDALGPSTLGPTSAVLIFTIKPQGAPTTFEVEYGTSSSYGTTLPLDDAGASTIGQVDSVELVGLQANSVYHYSVVAANAGGTVHSPDSTFMTPSAGAPPGGVLPAGLSLTGSASAGPAEATFSDLAALAPVAPAAASAKPPTTTSKPISRAERLSRALKACKKDRKKSRRIACEKTARVKYGTKRTKK